MIYKIGSGGATMSGRSANWSDQKFAIESATRTEGNSFDGKYSITGTTAEGQPYSGSLDVKKDGEGYDAASTSTAARGPKGAQNRGKKHVSAWMTHFRGVPSVLHAPLASPRLVVTHAGMPSNEIFTNTPVGALYKERRSPGSDGRMRGQICKTKASAAPPCSMPAHAKARPAAREPNNHSSRGCKTTRPRAALSIA